MPSKSKAQAHLMQAISHGWSPPADMKSPPSMAVAKEFVKADKSKKKKAAMRRRMMED